MPHRAHVPRRAPGADRAGDPGRGPAPSGTRRWPRCCRCSARTSSACSPRWTGCRPRSGCSTRRCTSSCPTAPSWRSGSPSPKATGEPDPTDVRLLAAVERLHETNPMLGLRGVRLGLVVPGLFALQVRAIVEAAAQRKRDGGDPQVEIMVPLVGSVMELHLVRDEIDTVVARGAERASTLRRPDRHDDRAAAGRADRAPDRRGRPSSSPSAPTTSPRPRGASPATTSRPSFFAAYLDKGVFTVSPFETLDRDGVGRAGAHGRRGGSAHPAGPQAGRLRRARRRPGVGALLPRRRASTTCRVRRSGCRSPAWRPGRAALLAETRSIPD